MRSPKDPITILRKKTITFVVLTISIVVFFSGLSKVTGEELSASKTLTLTSSIGGFVDVPGEGSFSYPTGTLVMVTVQAKEGFYFVSWTGSAVERGKAAHPHAVRVALIMNADYTLHANFARRGVFSYVDDDSPADPLPGDPSQSDPLEDGSEEHPFDTIQEAINASHLREPDG